MPDTSAETERPEITETHPATGLEYLNRLPWERMVTWAFVLFILYLLRDFFLVIFATFVICYFVRRLAAAILRRIPQHRHTVTVERAATLAVFLMLLGLFLGLLFAICPELFKQAQAVLRRAEQTNLQTEAEELMNRTLGSYLLSRQYSSPDAFDAAVKQHESSSKLGDGWWKAWPAIRADIASQQHKLQSVATRRGPRTNSPSDDAAIKAAFDNYASRNPDVHFTFETFVNWDAAFSKGQHAFAETVRESIASSSSSDAIQLATKDFEYDTRSALANRWLQTDPVADGLRHYLTEHQPEYLNELGQWTQRLIGAALLLPLHLGLALLVSLLICLDAPNIMNRVRSIRNSRVRSFYDEIAPMLSNFGRLTGKSLEAQFVIGAMNTLLTIIVLLALGVENIYFLSAIVFLSSIVPVIGAMFACTVVFLMATMQPDGSLTLAVEALIAVTMIHMVTSFIITPRIYGKSFHLHPVLVLVKTTFTHLLTSLPEMALFAPRDALASYSDSPLRWLWSRSAPAIRSGRKRPLSSIRRHRRRGRSAACFCWCWRLLP